MIVYGDPHYKETLHNLTARLQARTLISTTQGTHVPPLEELRTLLILAGQLEQAAHDDLPGQVPLSEAEQQIERLHAVTAHIADAFYSAWINTADTTGYPHPGTLLSLVESGRLLGGVDNGTDATLTVKMPEGFAFYALFPEQYCASALRWLADHAEEPEKRAAVVGIRSIGTTLGAVVAATLRARGWHVDSFTVRPTGHPFKRHVEIEQERVSRVRWGLVVDEGPGMSGSSMAAVGEALVAAGLRREQISSFPGHSGEPGIAASEEVRAWWAATHRYVTPLEQIRFEGRSLPQTLAKWVANAERSKGEAAQIRDVSGGLWREIAYSSLEQWPPVCAPFERPKLLCTLGSGERVLLKFDGLCGAPGGQMTTAEAVAGLLESQGEGSIGAHQGYYARRWIEGTPLGREDADATMLSRMGGYIARASGPPLPEAEQQAGLQRLAEMLYWNTWESLGEEIAERTRSWAEKMFAAPYSELPCYGDGRMASHEWIKTASGEVVKVDSAGHAWDHTCIGAQSVAWDIASAIVEWRLDDTAVAKLLDAFQSAGGLPVSHDALTFYRMAYSAFRVGQCHMCANMMAHDAGEQSRLWLAYAEYKVQLREQLGIRN